MTPNPTSAPAPQGQRELERARQWIAENQPEPSEWIYCGPGMTNHSPTSGMAWNPRQISPNTNHAYNFVIDPDWEAKRLAAYAKSVMLQLAEEATQLNTTKGGFLLLWRDVAAWLREKAQ